MNPLTSTDQPAVDFEKGNGLVPAIAQDVRTGKGPDDGVHEQGSPGDYAKGRESLLLEPVP